MASFYLNPISVIIQTLNNQGLLSTGSQIATYVAGSVSTPQTTYADNTGLVANPNPMTLSSGGRPAGSSGAPVAFWTASGVALKVVITDGGGTVLFMIDQVPAINDPAAAGSIQLNLANPATGFGADLVANAVKSYDTVLSLRAANTPSLSSGQTLIVALEGGLAVGDGSGGLFWWNAASSATDDGYSVVKPNSTSGNGRYLRINAAITVKNTNYTFAVNDSNNWIVAASGSSTYTIDGSASPPVGAILNLLNTGTGTLTVAGTNGAVITGYSGSSVLTVPPGQACRLFQYSANAWLILDPTPVNYLSGSFTGTLTGMTATVTGSVSFKVVGNRVSLFIPAAITGTSNTTAMTMTGLPAALQPTAQRLAICMMTDNTAAAGGWASVTNSGTVTFGTGINNNAAGFTGAGTKGLPLGWTISYDLS